MTAAAGLRVTPTGWPVGAVLGLALLALGAIAWPRSCVAVELGAAVNDQNVQMAVIQPTKVGLATGAENVLVEHNAINPDALVSRADFIDLRMAQRPLVGHDESAGGFSGRYGSDSPIMVRVGDRPDAMVRDGFRPKETASAFRGSFGRGVCSHDDRSRAAFDYRGASPVILDVNFDWREREFVDRIPVTDRAFRECQHQRPFQAVSDRDLPLRDIGLALHEQPLLAVNPGLESENDQCQSTDDESGVSSEFLLGVMVFVLVGAAIPIGLYEFLCWSGRKRAENQEGGKDGR